MDRNDFFISVKNWINNNINKKEINTFEKLTEDTISLLSFFNYLNLICNTVLEWFTKFEQIDIIRDSFLRDLNKEKNQIKINFINSKNKENAKKDLEDSLYLLGQELFNNGNIKQISINKVKNHLTIYYYFNEEKEEFVETSSDINLLQFLNNKVNSIIEFVYYFNEIEIPKNELIKISSYRNEMEFLNEKILEKDINSISEMFLFFKFDNHNNNKIFQFIESFLQNNKSIIGTYFSNTANNCYQPKLLDCKYFIIHEINKIFFNYLYPCMSFNNTIDLFSNNISIYSLEYNEYIDFSILINEIKNTKYHSSNHLNYLFQIKAINYIINGDSFLRLFLDELYIKKYKKKNRNNLFSRKDINEIFQLKVITGKKYTNQDLKELINNVNSSDNLKERKKNINSSKSYLLKATNEKNKIIKYKLKMPTKTFYSIVSFNQFKRKNPPISGFTGLIPNKKFFVGHTEQLNINDFFINKIIIKDKNIFEESLKNRKSKTHKGKRYYKQGKNENNFINLFDLIFSIKNYNNNIIVLEKNDISEIINKYEEKTFISLLNYNFPMKTKVELLSLLEKLDFKHLKI